MGFEEGTLSSFLDVLRCLSNLILKAYKATQHLEICAENSVQTPQAVLWGWKAWV